MSDEDLEKNHPEITSPKETSYCLFDKKTETYIKNGEEKRYERTTRIDRSGKVSCFVQKLANSGDSVLPKIKERHKERYIEMDFSENIAIKTKSKVQ